jgi:hypothetical protein
MNALSEIQIYGNPVRGPELRADAKRRHVALCKLIATLAETDPTQMSGAEWAGPMTQEQWAEKAGLSLRTFKRLILHPPIMVAARGVGKGKVTYLRLGAVDPHDLRKVQNSMAKLWRRHIGPEQAALRDFRRDYGLICGLAEDLPRGWQVQIFDYALCHWATFCAITKYEIDIANDVRRAGMTVTDLDIDEDGFATARRFPGEVLSNGRYFDFPALSFLRKFHHVAVTVYVKYLLETGKEVPSALQ